MQSLCKTAVFLSLLPLLLAPAGDDEVCPWCRNEPELMAAIGAVSHGPFPIAKKHTDELDRLYPGNPWIALETAHFRFVSNLGPESISTREREALAPHLDRLRAMLPDVPAKVKKLDPWLRLHLLALRSEEFYARFQRLLGVTDADFPESRRMDGPYMGDGRYLGEKGKFEVAFHQRRATHMLFTRDAMGGAVTDALRWHLADHRMLASIPAEDPDLAQTRWLFSHSVHLYSHLFLCAYKHFSYDPPIWLDEGLAHALEREVEPLSTTMDGDEGGGPHRGDRRDWSQADQSLVRKNRQSGLARLLHVQSFSDLSIDDHVSALSMVRFLVREHPERFAAFLGALKGQLDERGYPSGEDLVGLQRRLLKELWGWTVADFDAAWQAWVIARG